MSRPYKSAAGIARVGISATINSDNVEFIAKTHTRLQKSDARATKSDALNSIVEFAKLRRFDPIAPMKKVIPAPASTPAPAKPLPAVKA